MSRLLRHYRDNSMCFVTTVTSQRRRILIRYAHQLIESIEKYRRELDFELVAHVIMPDHVHLIIDPKGNSLSSIMQRIKLSFSRKVRYLERRSRPIWQARFWDHVIRDQLDLNRHVDYIHYNPVKHGLAGSPFDWEYTSIKRYARLGYYQEDWGRTEPSDLAGLYGE